MRWAKWLRHHRWMVALALVGLAVRLEWVLVVHPPEDFLYSDMAAYMGRAERLVAEPFGRFPDEAFFPFGTHYLLALPLAIFGPGSHDACAIWWALLSTAVVPLAYLLAGRLGGGPIWSAAAPAAQPPSKGDDDRRSVANLVARLSAAFVAIDYPLFSYAGYFLSETPFSLALTGSALFGLRLADHGRWRDAFAMGSFVAIGAAVRPQILVGFAIVVALFLWHRRAFPRMRPAQLALASLPIAAIVFFSLVQSHHHTGRASVLAQNGALNRAFGRCHAMEILGRGGGFGPPAFVQLHEARQRDPSAWPPLSPVLGPRLSVDVPLWDEDALNALADRCAKETGIPGQIGRAATHVLLLWGHNVAWPDAGHRRFRAYMNGWSWAHRLVFLPAMVLAMIMGASRRWPRHGLVAAYLWSLILVAMLVMGSARLRIPYDAIGIVLAFDVYARLLRWLEQRGSSSPSTVDDP